MPDGGSGVVRACGEPGNCAQARRRCSTEHASPRRPGDRMKAPQFAVGGRSPDGAARRRRSAGRKTASEALFEQMSHTGDTNESTGAGELRAGPGTIGVASSAHQFITGAEDFLPALEGGRNWKPPRARACPFVGAWALECALKSHLRPTRVSDEDLRSTDTTSRDFGGRLLNWICQCQVSRRTGVYYSIHYRSAVPSKVSRELQRIHRGAKK
jgi:hypothetical protein